MSVCPLKWVAQLYKKSTKVLVDFRFSVKDYSDFYFARSFKACVAVSVVMPSTPSFFIRKIS